MNWFETLLRDHPVLTTIVILALFGVIMIVGGVWLGPAMGNM